MNPFTRGPKVLAAWGAVVLWLVFPVVVGGFILTANSLLKAGKSSIFVVLGMGLWAAVALGLMLLGFSWLMMALFLWWKEKQHAPIVRTRVVDDVTGDAADDPADVPTKGSQRLAPMVTAGEEVRVARRVD